MKNVLLIGSPETIVAHFVSKKVKFQIWLNSNNDFFLIINDNLVSYYCLFVQSLTKEIIIIIRVNIYLLHIINK